MLSKILSTHTHTHTQREWEREREREWEKVKEGKREREPETDMGDTGQTDKRIINYRNQLFYKSVPDDKHSNTQYIKQEYK